MESLEGKARLPRASSRRFPAVVGLYGMPDDYQ